MDLLIENIKIIKKALNLSQAKMAAKLNEGAERADFFSKDQVYTYESGKAQPSNLFKTKLAAIAGVTIKDLTNRKLTEKDIKPPKSVEITGDANSISIELLLKTQAIVRVNASYIAEIYALLAKVPATQVLTEMGREASQQALNALEELKSKG